MELAPISGAFAGVLLESVGESELVTVAQQMGDGLDGHFCGFQEDFGFFQLLGLDILFGRAAYLALKDAGEIAAVNARHVGQGGYG
jgi:hypothetical protein|nr:hypothetical protein [uncultured Acetatifactor sp.]